MVNWMKPNIGMERKSHNYYDIKQYFVTCDM